MTDLDKTKALRPGDRCEFRYPAREQWLLGTVIVNGGSGYWRICDDRTFKESGGFYIEHVRAVGTDPWSSASRREDAPR